MKVTYYTDVNCGAMSKVVAETTSMDSPLTVFTAEFHHDIGPGLKPIRVESTYSKFALALRLLIHRMIVKNKNIYNQVGSDVDFQKQYQEFRTARILATTYFPNGTKSVVVVMDSEDLSNICNIQSSDRGWRFLYG